MSEYYQSNMFAVGHNISVDKCMLGFKGAGVLVSFYKEFSFISYLSDRVAIAPRRIIFRLLGVFVGASRAVLMHYRDISGLGFGDI